MQDRLLILTAWPFALVGVAMLATFGIVGGLRFRNGDDVFCREVWHRVLFRGLQACTHSLTVCMRMCPHIVYVCSCPLTAGPPPRGCALLPWVHTMLRRTLMVHATGATLPVYATGVPYWRTVPSTGVRYYCALAVHY